MDKLNLSVAIITCNEEKRLGRTLESIKDIAGEIIIIDSHSEDDTINLAKSYGAKVYTHDWCGFVKQKNLLKEKCSKNYILYLDADEEVSDSLKKSIIEAINNDNFDGYYIKRKTYYLGKLLNYSWQKDDRLRLVKAESNPLWIGEIVHEELKVDGNISHLKGHIIHHSYKDIYNHFEKTIKYARLTAESYYKKGKKFSLLKLIFSPIFSFIKMYILKLGFLDGIRGLIVAVSGYIYCFLKYIFLWELEKAQGTKNDK